MFERFTERARLVVALSQESARSFNHGYVGTEHLILALVREEEGIPARVLASFDVTEEKVTAAIERTVGRGVESVGGQIPFTSRLKATLEMALREALSMGHNYIGTEHLCLGLIRNGEGVGRRLLQDLDVDPENVRNEIIRILGHVQREAEENSSKVIWAEGVRQSATYFFTEKMVLAADQEAEHRDRQIISIATVTKPSTHEYEIELGDGTRLCWLGGAWR